MPEAQRRVNLLQRLTLPFVLCAFVTGWIHMSFGWNPAWYWPLSLGCITIYCALQIWGLLILRRIRR